jgi:hypothetical protein
MPNKYTATENQSQPILVLNNFIVEKSKISIRKKAAEDHLYTNRYWITTFAWPLARRRTEDGGRRKEERGKTGYSNP